MKATKEEQLKDILKHLEMCLWDENEYYISYYFNELDYIIKAICDERV